MTGRGRTSCQRNSDETLSPSSQRGRLASLFRHNCGPQARAASTQHCTSFPNLGLCPSKVCRRNRPTLCAKVRMGISSIRSHLASCKCLTCRKYFHLSCSRHRCGSPKIARKERAFRTVPVNSRFRPRNSLIDLACNVDRLYNHRILLPC